MALGGLIGARSGCEAIETVPFDDRVVVEVPIVTNHVTTLSFPGATTAIDGAHVATDPKTPPRFWFWPPPVGRLKFPLSSRRIA